MPLDLDAVGRELPATRASWNSKDALLYALGVGAGVDELPFTTENTGGLPQRVYPTFALVVGATLESMPDIGTFDLAKLVHAEQRLTAHRPLAVEGEVEIRKRVEGIYDKGKAALVATTSEAYDTSGGGPVFSTYSSSYIVGEGGWGGARGPSGPPNEAPARRPDESVTATTSRDQALLYRLSGDRNRLHSDPGFATSAGFPRPILHGLCTFGIAGRVLLHAWCDADVERFEHIEGRFTAPVYPGDTLTVNIWGIDESTAVFRVVGEDGVVVIDRGGFRRRG